MQLKFPRSFSDAFSTLAALLALAVATAVCAQTPNPDEFLAKNADTTMTRLDWEADLTRIPAPSRIGFASDPKRVQATVNNILVGKTLAARARAAGLDKDPVVQRRIELEADRVLLQRWIDKLEADAGAEFDRKGDANLPRARELYLLDKTKYDIAESVSAWHVLFTPAKHGGSDGALTAAKDARAKLAAGADFATLAKEISDDPSAKNNGGHLPNVPRGATDPEFEKAAFALKTGELSEPVQTRFGWHVIRVDAHKVAQKRTFDDVKGSILADMREKYVKDAREAAINAVRNDPKLVVNQPALDSLVTVIEMPKEMPAPAPAPVK